MPFANDLYPAPQAREPTSKSKAGFPTVVQLSLPAKGAGVLGGSSGGSTTHAAAERGSYFVIRAHSWRSLLRAMAWHGNSRVEAGPQEVADAASAAAVMRAKGKRTDGGCHLLVEIEFVTPTTTTMSAGFGIGDYARTLGGGGGGTHHAPAHVALCLSLVRPSLPNSAESAIRKRESRNLDAIYSGRGSARRVIGLPRESPALPMLLVKLAQHLHRAHAFSAQCPSTGSVARHSPRDLHHAIERHDQDYLAKRRANADGNQGSSSSGQSPGHGGWSSNSLGGGGGGGSGAGNGQHGPSSEHDLVEMAVEDDDGSGEGSSGRLGRMKAKLSRKLHIRAGDGRVVDEDLATWITPFEMNEHG